MHESQSQLAHALPSCTLLTSMQAEEHYKVDYARLSAHTSDMRSLSVFASSKSYSNDTYVMYMVCVCRSFHLTLFLLFPSLQSIVFLPCLASPHLWVLARLSSP